MTRRNDSSNESWRQYGRHVARTLAILGAILLVGVSIGVASEVCLHAARAPDEVFVLPVTSIRATFSVALVSLRAALPLVLALVAAPVLIAHLIHDLHGTGSASEAHDRVNQLLFGSPGPTRRAVVKEGQLDPGEDDIIKRIGGPGSLTVHADSAVVTERQGRLKRVLRAGTHHLEPYERVWEAVDLRPQRWVREVFGLTKEGIPISCDVDMLFRIGSPIDGNGGPGQTQAPEREQASVHREEAVLRAAAGCWIAEDDRGTQPTQWVDRVATLVESTLRDILATYRLDWLIRAPESEQTHPRDEIRRRLEEELKPQLNTLGAELVEVDLGQMRIKMEDSGDPEDQETSQTLSELISDQWIDAWQANWQARAVTNRAEGEAELLRMDTARIEAQAEMIIGLAEILQPLVAGDRTSDPYVLALRTVEALSWMSYDPKTRDYMPPEALRTLRRLRNLLESESAEPEPRMDTEPGDSEA